MDDPDASPALTDDSDVTIVTERDLVAEDAEDEPVGAGHELEGDDELDDDDDEYEDDELDDSEYDDDELDDSEAGSAVGALGDRAVDLARRSAVYWPLLLVVGLALAVRLFAITAWLPTCTAEEAVVPNRPLMSCYAVGGDAYYYNSMAKNVANGDGFVITTFMGSMQDKADHPPGFVTLLAAFDKFGAEDLGAQRTLLAVLGALGCGLIGLLGWRINPRAPRATALVAGGIAAIYPGFWMSDVFYLSESLYIPLFALTLLAALRFWRRMDWLSAVLLGLGAGSVWLVRGEGVAFVGVMSVGVVLLRRHGPSFLRRVLLSGVACAVCVATMVPWVLYNLSRFPEPVYIATTGTALALNSCDETWEGPAAGWYSFGCLQRYSNQVIAEEGELTDSGLTRVAGEYVSANRERYPAVMAIRVGRVFEVYARDDTMARNTKSEGRPDDWVGWQRMMFQLMIIPMAFGVWRCRRRSEVLVPLAASALTAVAGVAVTFAIYRYRLAADLSILGLAAVGAVDATAMLYHRIRGTEMPDVPELDDELEEDEYDDDEFDDELDPDEVDDEADDELEVDEAGDDVAPARTAPLSVAAARARARAGVAAGGGGADDGDGGPDDRGADEPDDERELVPSGPAWYTALWRKGGVGRTEGARFLELIGLWALSVAQPVLEVFGKAGEELVARNVSGTDLILFAVVVTFLPPFALLVVTGLLRFVSPKVEMAAHRVVLGLLVGAFVLQIVGRLLDPPLSFVLALAVAGGGWFAIQRFPTAQQWSRYLSPAAIAFVALFLFSSGATPIIFDRAELGDVPLQAGNPVPVVMIVFDELPLTSLLDGKGQIDAELFPNFAELQRESTWFRNNTSVAAGTNWAVPAITTGNLPATIASPIAGVYKNSIFTFLGTGYHMDAQEVVTKLCDPSICPPNPLYTPPSDIADLFDRAYEVWNLRATAGPNGSSASGALAVDPGASGGTTDSTVAGSSASGSSAGGIPSGALAFLPPDMHDPNRLQRFVNALQPQRAPTFHFAHFVLPHLPFEFTPSGRTCSDGQPQFPIGANQYQGSWVSDWGGTSAKSRHLLQLQYVDQWLGVIIAQLKASGLWDTAAIAITADHGVNFEEGQLRAFTPENWHNLLYTPLFMRGPGLTPGAVDDRNANTMDIVPTIADMLQAQLPYETAGVSLLGEPETSTEKTALRNNKDTVTANGSFVTFDGTEGFERILTAEAAPPATTPNDPYRLFRIGKYPDMVGTPVDQLTVGTPSNLGLAVSPPGLDLEFNQAEGAVPCFVKGTLSDASTEHQIAIALNGAVYAVAPAGVGGQAAQIWAALPETAFADGVNQLTFYEVTGTPAAPELHPITNAYTAAK